MYQHLRANHFLKENLRDYVVDEEGRPLLDPNEQIKQQVSVGLIDQKLLDSTYVKRFAGINGKIFFSSSVLLLFLKMRVRERENQSIPYEEFFLLLIVSNNLEKADIFCWQNSCTKV